MRICLSSFRLPSSRENVSRQCDLSGSCSWHPLASPGIAHPVSLPTSSPSTPPRKCSVGVEQAVSLSHSSDPRHLPPLLFPPPDLSPAGEDTALTPPVSDTRASIRTSCLQAPPSSSHWGWEPAEWPCGEQVWMLGEGHRAKEQPRDGRK